MEYLFKWSAENNQLCEEPIIIDVKLGTNYWFKIFLQIFYKHLGSECQTTSITMKVWWSILLLLMTRCLSSSRNVRTTAYIKKIADALVLTRPRSWTGEAFFSAMAS